MKSGPLNGFLDFNKDGKIDDTEKYMGYMMFQEFLRDEGDKPDEDDNED